MTIDFDIKTVDFKKIGGLVPAIIQDAETMKVLMMGYMNEEALEKTCAEGKVTFFSRSKNRLWTKGETSNNFLFAVSIQVDCDGDTLLIKCYPAGAACHTGAGTCWQDENDFKEANFLKYLEQVILLRKAEDPSVSKSYTNSLFAKGINKIAQKVGEEAVELVIEAKDDDKELFMGEAADLLFHYLILLAAKGYTLEEVLDVLRKRHK
jgi:phosphoribosyl-AMP cyclohydrolase / phosphoribosyl-ATP pyrophosphohydrolase